MRAAIELEKAVSEIIERCNPVFLDDVVERSFYSTSIGSSYVIFHHDFYGKGLPAQTINVDASYSRPAFLHCKGSVGTVKYHVEMKYDPRFLFSSTSFLNMKGYSNRSGLGIFVSAGFSEPNVQLKIRPLAIGSRGPKFDEWFSDSMSYPEFKKYRNDMVAYLRSKREGDG